MHVTALAGATRLNSDPKISPRPSNPLRQGVFSSDYRAGIQSRVRLTPKRMLIKTGAGKGSAAGDGLRMVSSPIALPNEV